MPTTKKLVDLFRAIATDDMRAATAIATQISENEDRKGHRAAARSLRGALSVNSSIKNSAILPVDTLPRNGTGFLNTALVKLSADISIEDVVLAPNARRDLETVVSEWTNRDRLLKHGLVPRSKLLFHGPPGCGKSITARAIARELGLPIYLVRFDSIIGAYLGQTAIHLRQLFHFSETTPCVLLLDELDALGKQRGNPLDVGELDRIVIALLQELEHSKPLGLIIATSNLAKNLDDALWRRFDLSLIFKAPTKSVIDKYCRHLAGRLKIPLSREVTTRASKVQSFADAEAIVVGEARRLALLED